MSEANKAAMEQFFERVYNQGDIAFLDELTAPEFVSHDRGNPTNDREGVKQIVGAIKTAFPDVAFTADDVIGEGDRVAARFTMRAPRPVSSWVCRRRTRRSLSPESTSFASKAEGRGALARVERHGVAPAARRSRFAVAPSQRRSRLGPPHPRPARHDLCKCIPQVLLRAGHICITYERLSLFSAQAAPNGMSWHRCNARLSGDRRRVKYAVQGATFGHPDRAGCTWILRWSLDGVGGGAHNASRWVRSQTTGRDHSARPISRRGPR